MLSFLSSLLQQDPDPGPCRGPSRSQSCTPTPPADSPDRPDRGGAATPIAPASRACWTGPVTTTSATAVSVPFAKPSSTSSIFNSRTSDSQRIWEYRYSSSHLLKASPSQATPSLQDAPVNYFSASVPRRPTSLELTLGSSPPGIATPHSVLFERSALDMGTSEAGTPGSSFSSKGTSLTSAETLPTSYDESISLSKSEYASFSDASTIRRSSEQESTGQCSPEAAVTTSLEDLHLEDVDTKDFRDAEPIPMPLRRPSLNSRRRSRSDVGLRSGGYSSFRRDSSTEIPPSAMSSSFGSSSRSSELESRDSSPLTSPSEKPFSSFPLRPVPVASDFSAYVSGLGQPIDPDIELSSVVQLHHFRMHSRSRSLGPGEDCSLRSQTYEGDPHVANTLGLSPRFARIHSPRPPLANVRDTTHIPSLTDLGSAVCNPGYILRSKHETGSDMEAPASPTLTPPRKCDDSIPALDDLDDKENRPSLQTPKEDAKALSSPRASRPAAAEPEPVSPEAFSDLDAQVCEDDDCRGRTRGRQPARSAARLSYRSGPSGGISSLPSLGEQLTRKRSARRSDDNKSQKRPASHDARRYLGATSPSASQSNRGRGARVKALWQDTTELPQNAQGGDTSVLPEETVLEEEQSLPRSRLLSNSSHLLMLSLEMAMIKHNKIVAPLKPRWGKRRDDDFRALPGLQERVKLHLSDAQHVPPSVFCTMNGSRLKESWVPEM